jgi:hypothetical protein
MNKLKELFEQVYMLSHLAEMAEIGKVRYKGKDFIGFTFSREYEFETPHINFGPRTGTVWAKVEIPPEMPKTIDDFDILMDRKKLNNNKFKKAILDFYQSIDKRGHSRWDDALTAWENAMEVHKK